MSDLSIIAIVILLFGALFVINKNLFDILQELKFLNSNQREDRCPHGYDDWDACPVCGH